MSTQTEKLGLFKYDPVADKEEFTKFDVIGYCERLKIWKNKSIFFKVLVRRKWTKNKVNKQDVYDYLTTIPKGKVVTYGTIAEYLVASALGVKESNNSDYWALYDVDYKVGDKWDKAIV